MTEGTVELWTLRCITALCRNLRDVLQWPDSRERRRIAHEIGQKAPFPDCVGFVDGCAVPLDVKPGVPDAVDYYNYKGFYALQLMAVVDNRRRFRFALLGFPGSAHDWRVWGYSTVSISTAARISAVSLTLLNGCFRSTLTLKPITTEAST